ncbi:hypothetical protein H2199_004199 [Coniosporium tulheliwenetii]|uniref:Uncharacterized protein n=1 Tax=Coniosporium tulheliwenetii TaxID=3383036 RepID=A0ACC2Z8S9_9PEZI|nr:hypothetical protein H2199_004199 [Cladosporium sp. JES 115]
MDLRTRLGITASTPQLATYLLSTSLFSISFLVFLNASISFLLTSRLGLRHDVGNKVGTLGFVDELVALVACPAWGVLSDRVGVRRVSVVGYAVVGLGLWGFVWIEEGDTHVWARLVVARMGFAVGGRRPTPSVSSELTITPARYRSQSPTTPPAITVTPASPQKPGAASTSQLAGLVGVFTGLGALVALGVFLPLPARFQKGGIEPAEAVARAFYIVGAVAFAVAISCFFGLRGLPGEERKSWRNAISSPKKTDRDAAMRDPKEVVLSYPKLLGQALVLGFKDKNIGLGYLGGFVARASSVAISLFIPLFTNAYFISTGRCTADPDEDMKSSCRRAYAIAAGLSGTSQLVALLCAPVFGYLSGRYKKGNLPLLLAAVAGMAGYISFGLLKSPDPGDKDGSPGVFFIVALLGISQIGAIVCSLGILSRGIHGESREEDKDVDGLARQPVRARDGAIVTDGTPVSASPSAASAALRDPLVDPAPPQPTASVIQIDGAASESSPLLPSHLRQPPFGASESSNSHAHMKGSIAGMYSLSGGIGILLLTKVGGIMFDRVDVGSPFFLMAGFNAVLFLAGVGVAFWEVVKGRAEEGV